MIITINNDDGTTSYDVNNINDDGVKQEATVIVQKVGNLQVIIEALDFASRTHRANLKSCSKIETKQSLKQNVPEMIKGSSLAMTQKLSRMNLK